MRLVQSSHQRSKCTRRPKSGATGSDRDRMSVGRGLQSKGEPDTMAVPPIWMTKTPSVNDECPTASSDLQAETAEECMPFLLGRKYLKLNEHGVPALNRDDHAAFLDESLEPLPAGFAMLDASRPWLFYWCLMGMTLLGEDVAAYRDS